MGIRLSTNQIHSQGVRGMLEMQKAVSRTQEQIASNKRVLTPADDPIAAARILQLNQELADIQQFNNTLSSLGNRLQREETAIAGISDLILKAQELIIQSGNATLNTEQRGYIATELQTVVDTMAQLMNAKDSSGDYLFAGYQGKTQPFVKGADGRYVYQGDEGQRFAQVGPVTSVAANDSGYAVFMDIPSTEPTLLVKAGVGNTAKPPAMIDDPQIRNAEQFAAFYPNSVVIEFRPVGEVSPAGLNYTIRQVSDGRVLSENVPYSAGSPIEFAGVSVRIQGRPAPGDTFMVESDNRKGLLTGLEDYIKALQQLGGSAEDQQKLATARASAITNLDNAQVRLLETRSAIGARLNQVESSIDLNADFELVVKTALSEVADLDYAKAISQLTQETFILEAAQASFSKIARLSLFNYF